jgi:hypothetical protein
VLKTFIYYKPQRIVTSIMLARVKFLSRFFIVGPLLGWPSATRPSCV